MQSYIQRKASNRHVKLVIMGESDINDNAMYNIAQAGRILGVSKATLYGYIKHRRINYFLTPGSSRKYILGRDIKNFFRSKNK